MTFFDRTMMEGEIMAKRFGLVIAAALLAAGSAARAEDAATDKLYGGGVHAYFAANYNAALKQFDAAVAAGSRDPRCYYYRGLAAWRLGKADAAKSDFSEGAKLEAASPEMASLINRSMQRVQGSTRLAIERFRTEAQLAALAARKARDAARYGAERASAIDELRKQAETPKKGAELLPDAAATPEAGAAEKDPFADEPATEEMPADDAAQPDAVPTRPAEPTDPNAPADEATPGDESAPGDEAAPMDEAAPAGEAAPAEDSGGLFGESETP